MRKMLVGAGVALSICGAALSAAPKIALCTLYDATSLPCPGVQEMAQLATANAAAAPTSIYGGTYIFTQVCTGYGTVALQAIGPDGATFATIASKTTADTSGGTPVQFQGAATVKVTLTGTTGCNVTLGRVP